MTEDKEVTKKLIDLLSSFQTDTTKSIQCAIDDIDNLKDFEKSFIEQLKNDNSFLNYLSSRNIKDIKSLLETKEGKLILYDVIENYLNTEKGKGKVIVIFQNHVSKKILGFVFILFGFFGSVLSYIFYQVLKYQISDMLDKQ